MYCQYEKTILMTDEKIGYRNTVNIFIDSNIDRVRLALIHNVT
jgi:hypothetical protein